MSLSHDSLVANIVCEYARPQKPVYMLTATESDHQQRHSTYVGYFDQLMKIFYEAVVVWHVDRIANLLGDESDGDDDDESVDDESMNNIANNPMVSDWIINFVQEHETSINFVGNEWKLIIADAMEIMCVPYDQSGAYTLFESDPATCHTYPISRQKLIEMLRQ